ncbi:endonuclease [Elizabethkingia meningoseptica]|uniref:GIY-YIG nuclease family protein n=1 Tax=Elizabethkingia meningoseptica TaxID=238 RepID=UPI000332CA53|nr:GIY-YIG nuclease family protein [Elizabethkingia meningoseptica]AQX05169.1 endonuclease [Elizabethkingia meningoseptica]AQX47214.1 endonuclease [Elizabethkingia meningoseptica]EOR29668.1 endonuclease containing a URI domain [Elizabethkingia meningoseptica ATCC 13253 = NBRC 12535]MDE5489278.1 GIY-YIG nuclease family protein [Elizabethkingia meningoseptica]MVW93332.1 GIY-YIG nuclease family protein [Elizabethkingia meningoseptica]
MLNLPKGIYTFYVYILTNKNRTVLYTGVTNNLYKRLYQHTTKSNPKSFTAKYNTMFLVYYEKFGWIQEAIQREKEIKNLTRVKKLELIRSINPNLDFLNHLFKSNV